MLRTMLMTAVLLATAPALAEAPASPPVELDKEVARLYSEGAEAADRGQWEEARTLFENAYKLQPRPRIAANLGRAELMVGKPCAAVEHLEVYLSEDKEADQGARRMVREVLDKATAKIGMVRVRVDVDGADIFVNGHNEGKSPLKRPLCFAPGSYTVEARASGRKPAIKDVALGANSVLEVELSPAVHRQDEDRISKVPAWRTPVLVGGLALGVIGMGVGIGFSVATAKKNPEIDREADRLKQSTSLNEPICAGRSDPRCARLFALGDKQNTYETAAVVSYAAGGLLGIGTAVLWHASRPATASRNRSAINVTVVPSPGGMQVFGTF